MYVLIFAVVSVVVVILFLRPGQAQGAAFVRLVAAFCFLAAWVGTVLWLIAETEGWQIALTIPGPHSQTMPGTGTPAEVILHRLVYLAPVSRNVLGILYALPALPIPLAGVLADPSRTVPILRSAAAICLIFFAAETAILFAPNLALSARAIWSLKSWGATLAALLWAALRAGNPVCRVAAA